MFSHSHTVMADEKDSPAYVEEMVESLCKAAKQASLELSLFDHNTINQALQTLSDKILKNTSLILAENRKDISFGKEKGLSDAMLDRLTLDEKRLEAIASSIITVQNLENPVGRILSETVRPNGLCIQKISVPIGVLGIIYESRPNVTIDAAILCLKSGNAAVLRCGSETLHSSLILHSLIQDSLEEHGLPRNAIALIPTRDRHAVGAMLRAHSFIDVVIPRGGKGLIERIMNEATMPVFGHLDGICHVYVHKSANKELALNVTLNAKMRRTGICGAMETLLLDKNLPPEFSRSILMHLLDSGCVIVGDENIQKMDSRVTPATSEDWSTEYLDKKLSCRFVDSVQDAVKHINTYGSHHTDSILCEDDEARTYFLRHVDSGIVMHNTSTQFADGGEFGMGAEIGIGTGKLHARGPVGIEQLCTYKYIVHGNGQIRP